MSTRPDPATIQYRIFQRDIPVCLRAIATALKQHATRQRAHPGYYGYVGDVARVKAQLREVLEGLK